MQILHLLLGSCIALAAPGSTLFAAPESPSPSPASWRESLEADWLLQARVQSGALRPAQVTPEADAAGGCDGVTNGQWGFHTAEEDNPWWQVDLGSVHPIRQVRLWNRADNDAMAARARNFRILLSDDGRNWRTAYQHDGSVFYGYRMPDRYPLGVALTNAAGRFVRIQLPGRTFLHLDEVEVIRAGSGGNIAANRPATQSSVSPWSVAHASHAVEPDWAQLTRQALENCRRMNPTAEDLSKIEALGSRLGAVPAGQSARALYLEARALQRGQALATPLLDFDAILFTKRVPGSYNHMSDQYYGWWSRPGGGLNVLRGFKTGEPRTECLTEAHFKQPGSFLRPSLSYDGKKVLFAWCRHYPELAAEKDKLNKANVPEDAFYHVYEMALDGSAPRQLTHGKYDDFDARYLPDGRLVFISTRRGQSIQAGRRSAQATLAKADLPDCYVRCGGDASRPVAVYTLHTMNADGTGLTAISPFEMFEWEPSVADDGTILYSRWDYVDRDNMPYMSLWAINPDGTNARLVYGNYTKAPHCTFEPRTIPGSRKIVFTASGHHSQTMGSLVVLDPSIGTEGAAPITRLTPDTPFPEIEGWPEAFYANPWPLSEKTHLVAWGIEEGIREGRLRPMNGMGLYLFNADSGLELLYRDPEISAMYPIPLQSRPAPPALADHVDWDGAQEGRFLIADVTRGLKSVKRGDVKALRVVAVPAKTQPWMNRPVLGLTADDPGKAVLGTVPVEPDGSAYFRVPSGVAVFFQALDAHGRSIQTMRSATHVQPGQTLSCTGCHDARKDSPPGSTVPMAAKRAPSKLTPGPEGSWPLRFDRLIQPTLDARCVSCHRKGSPDEKAAPLELTPAHAYDTLTRLGKPSVRDLVLAAYRDGTSTEGRQPARNSSWLAELSGDAGHHGVKLTTAEQDRFVTWLDTYAQRQGHFSEEQERELVTLRHEWTALLAPNP